MVITDSLVKIFVYLYQEKDKKVYSSIIAKKTDKTHSHVAKVISDLKDLRYVER